MKKHSSSENIREKANPYPPYKKLPIVEKIIMKEAEIHIALFNNLVNRFIFLHDIIIIFKSVY